MDLLRTERKESSFCASQNSCLGRYIESGWSYRIESYRIEYSRLADTKAKLVRSYICVRIKGPGSRRISISVFPWSHTCIASCGLAAYRGCLRFCPLRLFQIHEMYNQYSIIVFRSLWIMKQIYKHNLYLRTERLLISPMAFRR